MDQWLEDVRRRVEAIKAEHRAAIERIVTEHMPELEGAQRERMIEVLVEPHRFAMVVAPEIAERLTKHLRPSIFGCKVHISPGLKPDAVYFIVNDTLKWEAVHGRTPELSLDRRSGTGAEA